MPCCKASIHGDWCKDALQYATFEMRPRYVPLNDFVKVVIKVLIPLQAALFALAIRNRFRRQ
jgi:hypothetical protein